MAMKNLANQINKAFGNAFGFPKDFVHAHSNNRGELILRIGCRDLQVDRDGGFIGQGTDYEMKNKIKFVKLSEIKLLHEKAA